METQLTFTGNIMSTLSVNKYLHLENKCRDIVLISVKQTTRTNYYINLSSKIIPI